MFDQNKAVHYKASLFYQGIRIAYKLSDILTSITFADKRQIVPLQAADMLAYEAYKYSLYWDEHKLGMPPRKLFQNLIATECITMGRYNKWELQELADKGKLFMEYIDKKGLQEGALKYLEHNPPQSPEDDLDEDEGLDD